MKKNMLIVHGGAPTAVINASLYGAIKQAKKSGMVNHIWGARGGSHAVLTGDFIDLGNLPEETVELLPITPASFIGSSRYQVTESDYERMVDVLVEKDIQWLLFTGGNGSMDTCGKIAKCVAKKAPGKGICVTGIPKTIDNDIAVTDHAPGFGSAARYVAATVRDICADVASLPIHVCVVETMGRNAGWLTAAAALAGGSRKTGPHLIYVPEIAFDEEAFLDNAKTLYDAYGGVVVVASEGLRDKTGKPIVDPIFQVGRSVYYGDVSAHLCNLVIRKLGIKARSEKPGLIGRCAAAYQSSVDRAEAIEAGTRAVQAALAGKTAVMVGFKRVSTRPYRCETVLIPVEEVMLHERTLPAEFLTAGTATGTAIATGTAGSATGIATATAGGTIPSEAFVNWCEPLIGDELPPFAR
ncbi:diphosphate--fructose-6-phosphate 1-phosphotransferase [Treponema brennaborense]|uniref:Pyrophosphate--fructose 6-phosphate 1-phosphotransferase n=1 Tax=Treponema brennaborense (strain DSM 12168 / CIP 105900 / DD5/3) TaxID=906968 RepID=F4LMD1_TREBD|nr:diphosphate--fructose-6-phosphate 1-phosphotransferase [Treponema brennaborense]AEE17797.1 phosphofructokinase [Treponema brennaborense DSM 12168]